MDIPSTLRSPKFKTQAAQDEIRSAIDFHEAWKPAAYDKDLNSRMGTSYATNTFLVIRNALRREMLLSLMRLWDRSDNGLRLESIANTLRDRRVLDALAAECEAQWIEQPVYTCAESEPLEPEIQAMVEEACKGDAIHFAKITERISKKKRI